MLLNCRNLCLFSRRVNCGPCSSFPRFPGRPPGEPKALPACRPPSPHERHRGDARGGREGGVGRTRWRMRGGGGVPGGVMCGKMRNQARKYRQEQWREDTLKVAEEARRADKGKLPLGEKGNQRPVTLVNRDRIGAVVTRPPTEESLWRSASPLYVTRKNVVGYRTSPRYTVPVASDGRGTQGAGAPMP